MASLRTKRHTATGKQSQVLGAIAHEAIERKTGARGLRSIVDWLILPAVAVVEVKICKGVCVCQNCQRRT
jgi:ATP-dependent protease Clp ATPase subunit